MKRSKFYDLIRILSEQELKAFSIHLKENRHELGMAFSIFEHIHSFAPYYNSKLELDRDFLIKKFFQINPDASSRKRFYNELSKLSNKLKDFLVWERIKSQPFEKSMILAQLLKERNLRKESVAALNNAQKTLAITSNTNTLVKSNNPFHLLNYLKYYHFKYYATESLKLTSDPKDIKSTMQYLDLFYLSSKLKYSCEIESRNKIKKEETSISLIKESIDLIVSNSKLKIPIVEVYLQSYKLVSTPSAEQFKSLHKFIMGNSYKISNRDKKIIFTYLINFCANQIRKGAKSYLQEAYNIYEYLEKEKLLLDGGIIATTRFNNIIDVACKVKNFKWAEQFIETNAKFLTLGTREETIRIARAVIHFEKEEYGKSLLFLREGRFKNIDHALRSRWLIICCFCALGEETSLDSICKATRQYLKRVQGINKEIVKGTQNLIIITKQINKYRYQKKNKKEQLKKKLSQLNPIIFKTWLEELIDKM